MEPGEITTHLAYIRQAVDGVNGRLDKLNGQVQETKTKVAILEDRSTEIRQEARDVGRKSAIRWASGIGAALALVETVWNHIKP